MAQHAKSEAVSIAAVQPAQKAHVVLEIEFHDEVYKVDSGGTFTIDRVSTLTIGDNSFLRRSFLVIESCSSLWQVNNVGSRAVVTVVEATGMLQSWIGPGSQTPLVVPDMSLVFIAGPTTYEIGMTAPDTMYEVSSTGHEDVGEMAMGWVTLTPSQRLLTLTLAENWLRRVGTGPSDIPRSEKAAQRLEWTQTHFNRRPDSVCEELDGLGMRGLRGGKGVHATYHRAGLVEYTVASQLITAGGLTLLDEGFQANQRRKAVEGSRRSRGHGQKQKSEAHHHGGSHFISGFIGGADPRGRGSGWVIGDLVAHVVIEG